jgi:predicted  nucleic acid-binding Zn-ribbon protein
MRKKAKANNKDSRPRPRKRRQQGCLYRIAKLEKDLSEMEEWVKRLIDKTWELETTKTDMDEYLELRDYVDSIESRLKRLEEDFQDLRDLVNWLIRRKGEPSHG